MNCIPTMKPSYIYCWICNKPFYYIYTNNQKFIYVCTWCQISIQVDERKLGEFTCSICDVDITDSGYILTRDEETMIIACKDCYKKYKDDASVKVALSL